jgi:lipoprotein signal peptidase
MSTLNLNLWKLQHPATIARDWTHSHRVPLILTSIFLLIGVDQITKQFALWWAPAAAMVMADSSVVFGIGCHIHHPNPYSFQLAILAFGLAGILWLLPVSGIAKVLWTAAALSNHIEMLLRPGTVDFLSVGFESRIWIANIADVYFVIGIAFIAGSVWTMAQTNRVRVCAKGLENLRSPM